METKNTFINIDDINSWFLIRQLSRIYDCKIFYVRNTEEYLHLESSLKNIPLFSEKKYIFYVKYNDEAILNILSKIPLNNYYIFSINPIEYKNNCNIFIQLDTLVSINRNLAFLKELYLIENNTNINFGNYLSAENYLYNILKKLELLYIAGATISNNDLTNLCSSNKTNSFSKLANDIYNQNIINYTLYEIIDPLALSMYIQRIAINKFSRCNSIKDEEIIKMLFHLNSYIKKHPEYAIFLLDQHVKSVS